MKNILQLSLLCATMLYTSSCTEEVEYRQEQYKSVAYMKNSGLIDMKFYNTGDDISYNTAVCRGGTSPELVGKIKVEPFTPEEMETYNKDNSFSFKQIPEGYYELSTSEITFEPGQEYAPISITLKSNLPELSDGEYILPICLRSDDFSVNSNYKNMILRPEVVTPMVSFSMDTDMYTTETVKGNMASETSFGFPLFLDYGDNTKDFEVYFQKDPDQLQTLVAEYNEANGTDMTLLPQSAYSFDEKVSFTGGITIGELLVTLTDGIKDLDYGEYLLPVQMTQCGLAPFDVDTEDIRYLQVIITPNYQPLSLDGSNITGKDNEHTNRLKNLLDGNLTTTYQAGGNDDTNAFNSMNCIYFDIDMEDSYDGVRLSYICNSTRNCGILNKVEVYASADKSHWTKVGDNYDFLDKMQHTISAQEFTTMPGISFGEDFTSGAQYIRVCIMDYRWQRADGSFTIYDITNYSLNMTINELRISAYNEE